MYRKTIDHLFVECIEAKNYYYEIRTWLEGFDVILPSLNKFNILLGVDNELINFIIVLYKYSLYKTRENHLYYRLHYSKI